MDINFNLSFQSIENENKDNLNIANIPINEENNKNSISNSINLNSIQSTNLNSEKDFSDDILICNICGKKLGNLKNLKKHYKLHTGLREYKCKFCDKSYKRSDHLNRHMIVHQEDKTPFECSYCYKKFSYKYHLKTHINNIHILNPFKFKCEICGEFFHKKIKLLKHQRREHKEKIEKIKCYYPYCYKSYLTQSKLDEHIKKIHHNLNVDDINHEIEEKNKKEKYFYKCPFDDCKKIYSTHFNLLTHIKTFHLKIKNFQCDICNKKFFHNSSLKRHILDFHNKNNQQENQIINVENNIQNNIHIDNSFNDTLFDLSDNSNILFNSNQYI